MVGRSLNVPLVGAHHSLSDYEIFCPTRVAFSPDLIGSRIGLEENAARTSVEAERPEILPCLKPRSD